MLEVRVLGPVGATDGTGELDPGGPTACAILGLLATNAPATVPAVRLAEGIWGEAPPASAHKTLQAHVSKLRRALRRDRTGPGSDLVQASGDGYRLDPDAVTTDLARFRALIDTARCSSDSRAALDRWRGEPLGGCVDTPLVEAERTRLREERLSALERWATLSIEEGRPDAVVIELEAFLAANPLREPLWALLIEAHAASGRQRDALAAYQRARHELATQAGIEPGRRLRAAEETALADDGPLPPSTPVLGPRGLPARRSSVVGRDHDISRIADLARRHRLVVVTGTGGAGKTTVATAAGRTLAGEFRGGAVFVDLSPVNDDEGVVRAVAAAWGLTEVGDAERLAASVAAQVDAATLLILDNCEHVMAASAAVVDRLLDAAEPLTVLATSRQALEIAGEHVWPLSPLPIEEAANLFTARAGARHPDTAECLDRGVVRDLCEDLDRLPLAIELAAARVGHLSPSEIADGIAHRPDLLRRDRGGDDRHDSLTAAIRWSHDLLDPRQRRCLARLAVFPATFDLARASAVLAGIVDPGEVPAVLGELVGRSLVEADTSGAATRYRLLVTIRAFAWGEAQSTGEADQALVRHRDWYLHWARAQPPGATALRLGAAYELEPHHDDLVVALETSRRRAEAEAQAQLAVLASGLLFCPGGQADAEGAIAGALEHADELPESVVADLLGLGSLTGFMSAQRELGRSRMLAGARLAPTHRRGAAPLALVLALADPFSTDAVIDVIDDLLADPRGLRNDLHLAIAGMHPMRTFGAQGLDAALAEADTTWSDRRWSDDHTLATWTVHAALLHIAGEHDRLAPRLQETEHNAVDGPSSPFLGLFEALVLAATGAPATALDRLREVRRLHWVHLAGIENDFLAGLAAIADLAGDRERARRLLDRDDLWPRHPGTALVQLHHRRRLGLPPPPFLGDVDHTEVSAVLDAELGR